MKKKSITARNVAVWGIGTALIIVLQALSEGLKALGLQMSFALGLLPVLVFAQLKDWKTGLYLGTVFGLVSFVIGLIQMGGIEGFVPYQMAVFCIIPRAIVGLVCSLLAFAFDRYWTKKDAKAALKAQNEQQPQAEQGSDESPLAQEVKNDLPLSAEVAAPDKEHEAEATPVEEVAQTKKEKAKRFTRDYLCSVVVTLAGVLLNTIGFLGLFYAFMHGKNVGGLTIDFKYILAAVVAINTVIEIVTFSLIVPAIVSAIKKSRFLH